MKKTIICMLAAIAVSSAFGIAASQAWVSNYVAQAISRSAGELQATTTSVSTGGVTVVSVGSGSAAVRFTFEEATDAALCATNCTASAEALGVTNGLYFVWNGAGAYVNPVATVTATPSNLVFNGVASVRADGFERFDGLFDARSVLLQPAKCHSITNATTEVGR